jgi:hypothetical protein
LLTRKKAAKQKREEAHQLDAATRKEIIDKRLFYYQAFGLKFKIQDSLKETKYKPEHSFGSFINMYLDLLGSNTKK